MRSWRIGLIFGALATLSSACGFHIVGDSTAWLVQYWANEATVTISGTPTPSCGYTTFNGNRIAPGNPGDGYPACVLDATGLPDDPDDVIVAFVSIHDAMCSTVDGCLPIDTEAYANAHADLLAMGHDVVWVEVPEVGMPELRARINELNAAVATELGCTLVDKSIREAPMWDGLHYVPSGGWTVAVRLDELIHNNPPLCP